LYDKSYFSFESESDSFSVLAQRRHSSYYFDAQKQDFYTEILSIKGFIKNRQ